MSAMGTGSQDLDPGALAAVRDFYEDLQIDGRVLDLGGTAFEHFNVPPDALLDHPVAERLPFEDGAFDDVVCFAGIGAMAQPLLTFAEVARVLRPHGRFVCSFTGRGEPESPLSVWRDADDAKRVRLVRDYFKQTDGFGPAESDLRSSLTGEGDRLWAVWATRLAP